MNLFPEKQILFLLIPLLFISCAQQKENQEQANTSEEVSFESLYQNSSEYETYIADLQNEKWQTIYNSSDPIREDLLAAAQVIPGSWKLLVINNDETVDAVNTIPYIAKLARRVHSLELRITSPPEQANQITGRYQTYNERSAYPVILLIDEDYREVGCWVERPAELQRRFSELSEVLSDGEIEEALTDWYQQNGGVRTIDEIIKIIHAANSGDRICPVPEEGLRGR